MSLSLSHFQACLSLFVDYTQNNLHSKQKQFKVLITHTHTICDAVLCRTPPTYVLIFVSLVLEEYCTSTHYQFPGLSLRRVVKLQSAAFEFQPSSTTDNKFPLDTTFFCFNYSQHSVHLVGRRKQIHKQWTKWITV